MTRRISAFILAAVLALGVTQAAAQHESGFGYVTIDGGIQATSADVTSSVRYKLYGEDAVMKVTYQTEAAPLFSARAGVRVWRQLTLGGGITRFTDSTPAKVEAQIPHPFFFQRQRSIEGTADALTREETAFCAEVGWLIPLHPKMDLMVFAGPAFFSAKQDMATRPIYTETYPFDTATYSGVESSVKTKSATGFTVGADFTYRFTTHLGVGGLVRFSRATVELEPVPDQPVTFDLGGPQFSVGVRFRF